MKRTLILFAFLTLPLFTYSQSGEEEVKAVVDGFFRSISSGDTVTLKSLFFPDVSVYMVMAEGDSIITRNLSGQSGPVASEDRQIEEKPRPGMKVEVHENIAMVWAPYELWMNGQFSHCGIDTFTLLQTNEGWKIAQAAFSIEKTSCNEW